MSTTVSEYRQTRDAQHAAEHRWYYDRAEAATRRLERKLTRRARAAYNEMVAGGATWRAAQRRYDDVCWLLDHVMPRIHRQMLMGQYPHAEGYGCYSRMERAAAAAEFGL